METLFKFWNGLHLVHAGLLLAILWAFSYFLVVLLQRILFRVVIFRRVRLRQMSKHERALFNDERKLTLRDEFLALVVLQISFDYAHSFFQVVAHRSGSNWTACELVFKSLLAIYLWAYLFWYDLRRWKERERHGKRDIWEHCLHYANTLWMLIAIIFLVFQIC